MNLYVFGVFVYLVIRHAETGRYSRIKIETREIQIETEFTERERESLGKKIVNFHREKL